MINISPKTVSSYLSIGEVEDFGEQEVERRVTKRMRGK